MKTPTNSSEVSQLVNYLANSLVLYTEIAVLIHKLDLKETPNNEKIVASMNTIIEQINDGLDEAMKLNIGNEEN